MKSIEVEISENISRYGQAPWRYLAKPVSDHAPAGTKLYCPYVGDNLDRTSKLLNGNRLMVWIQVATVTEQTTRSAIDKKIVQLLEGEAQMFFPDNGKWYYELWQANSEAAKIVLDKKQWLVDQADEILIETNKLYKDWKEKNARS